MGTFEFSTSHTTRPMRQNETHGKEYYFVTESFFQEKTKEDFFLEWAKVHGDYYGTSYQEVLGRLEQGKRVILDIDVQGGMALQEKGIEGLYVSLQVSDKDLIRQRLKKRGTESAESLALRLSNADKELALLSNWPHVIMNDDLMKATEDLERLLTTKGFL